MLPLRRILFVAVALLYLFPGLVACGQAYTSIVVFGDSLSDVGNDATLSAAKYTLAGQVPGPFTGYTNGRFTDGTDTVPAAHNYNGVWVEQFAAMLAAKPAIKNSLAGGLDYAYGFGTTNTGTTLFTYGPSNSFSFTVNNMGQQVTDYLATSPTITNKTLFVVWGGANDLINATTPADIANAAARDAALVQRLIAAGATDFIVPNLPPLGLVPRFNGSAATSVPATQAAQGFDQALAAALAGIPAANPGKTLHIYQLDIYTLFNTIVGPPIMKTFANVTASAQLNPAINPDTYLFWDDLHPTTYGHSLIATAAFTLIGTPVVTTTSVASNNSNANLGASVTLTASVVATSGTPTGTVTFMDGSTSLGSALVTGSTTTATASLTTTALSATTHTITAVFAGVNGYASSTSPAITEVVTAPSFSAGFSAGSTLTIKRGGTGTAALTLTPVGGYSGTATFACGTLPAQFTCSISPTSVTLGGNVQSTTVVTIGTAAMARSVVPSQPGAFRVPEIVTAFTVFPFLGLAGFAGLRRRKLSASKLGLLVLAVMLSAGAMLGVTGCGGSSGAPAGSYVVPITITSNGTTTSTSLTVVVQ